MFGAKAGTNYEGLQIPSLPPGIYHNYELTDVKLDTATKQDGTVGKRIITFLFEGPQGAYQHTEWEILPTDNGAEKKAENLEKRIGHILHKFISQEVIDANVSTTWDQYTAWIMSALGASYKGVKVDFKIIGNVYKGTAKAVFPNYIGFIVKSGEPLIFSASEKKNNDEYEAFYAKKPDAEGGAGIAPPPTTVDADF